MSERCCLLNGHCKEAKSKVCSIERTQLAKPVGYFDFGQVLCALECLDRRYWATHEQKLY